MRAAGLLTRDEAFEVGLLCGCGGATEVGGDGTPHWSLPRLDDGRPRPLCGCFRKRLRQAPPLRR